MTARPERSAARDAAITAMLPHVPFEGWTARALRRGLADLGVAAEVGRSLFPAGTVGLIAAWSDLLDREMEASAEPMPGTGARVRALIALRLRLLRPHREAARRALAALARLGAGNAAACIAARTADSIWHAAGDRATDFSWYTKRASLSAIYAATLLYWLGDESDEDAASLAFLDHRLAGVAAIGRIRRRFTGGSPRNEKSPSPLSPSSSARRPR
ncbi:MAG: COQ9 family protein [Acetobacteraceae bacterium]